MSTTKSASAAGPSARKPRPAPQPAALYPGRSGFEPKQGVPVGGVILAARPIEYNTGRKTVALTVRNTGDRPVQVGSHFHFFEVNRYLEFDRGAAFGCHLNIPATTAVRFEPGDQKEVEVVVFGGKQRVVGFNGLVMGYTGDEGDPSYYPVRMRAIRRMRHEGFKDSADIRSSAQPQARPSAGAARSGAARSASDTDKRQG